MLRRKRPLLFFVGVCVSTGIALYLTFRSEQPIDELLKSASIAFEQQRYDDAEALAEQVLSREESNPRALIIAGKAADTAGRPADAVGYFLRLNDDQAPDLIPALSRSVELLFYQLGRMSDAHTAQQRLTKLNPDPETLSTLAFLQTISGQRHKASEPLLELVKQNWCSIEQLRWIGIPELAIEAPGDLKRCRELTPEDPLPQLGLAFSLKSRKQDTRAVELLRTIVRRNPDLLEAQLLLGNLIVDSVTDSGFKTWHQSLPESADSHSDTWSIRGRWTLRAGNRDAATRCFLEAAARNPDHKYALGQLAHLLTFTDSVEVVERFSVRSKQLVDYQVALEALRADLTNLSLIREAAKLTSDMGRLWESRAWCRKALEINQRLSWPWEMLEEAEARLKIDSPQTIAEARPTFEIDLSRWPLPDLSKADASQGKSTKDSFEQSAFRFQDVAEDVDIEFVYFNGHNPNQKGIRMYETVGGGVAALDYDADGWPDLFYTQGAEWPVNATQQIHLDRLYRNTGTGTFEDVTNSSDLLEPLFGQGLSVGDFDGDGFPDLFIGNIGENRLLRNNGDGSFTDITDNSGVEGAVWTSSCAFADLNGDGFADIYEVNYLKGKDLFTTVCVTPPDRGVMCAPKLFQAEQDRIYINQRDGTFEEVSASSGIESDHGMGMGIVIADFDNTGRLGAFVANDHVYNFYFVNETESRGAPLKLRECAFIKGLAVNADGWGQACMGVAAGDIQGNGLLDLFITNFYRESNCLYLHQPEHNFIDDTRRADLRDSSLQVTGWGTQFLDIDLDGHEDLVVTNGHVEDSTRQNVPYRMKPLLYRNVGSGRFKEVDSKSLGGFFQREQLGRGLARLDWNRDGKEDFAVSHLDTPAALITNQTDAGNYFALQLRGVDSERDAIGTIATIECGDFKRVRQLVAGDGFQASNQKQLVFGLGNRETIDRLTIRWPNGHVQTWEKLEVNTDVFAIEGQDTLFTTFH